MATSPLTRLTTPALLCLGGSVVWSGHLPAWLAGAGWLNEGMADDLHNAAAATTLLSLAWFCARTFRIASVRGGRRVPRLLSDMVSVALFAVAGMIVLSWVYHLPIGGLVTTSGVMVAVLGLAWKEIIGDIFGGVALNMERPYQLGDFIELPGSGLMGKVVEINWRATRVETLDKTTIVLPNGPLAASRIVNYNLPQRWFRIQYPLTLEFDVPPERARRLLLSAMRQAPLVLSEPGPEVVIDAVTDQGVRYVLRYFVMEGRDMVPARDHINTNILRSLRLAGITLSHRRQDVTLARRSRRRTAQRLPDLLQQLDLFQALEPEDQETLGEEAALRTVPRGNVVVETGEEGASLFVVVEGLLEVRGASGVLASLGPGEVFGEMSLLTGAPRSATVTATTEAVLMEITHAQLRPILHRRPEVAQALARVVAERQRANERRDGEVEHVRTVETPLFARIRDFFGLCR